MSDAEIIVGFGIVREGFDGLLKGVDSLGETVGFGIDVSQKEMNVGVIGLFGKRVPGVFFRLFVIVNREGLLGPFDLFR